MKVKNKKPLKLVLAVIALVLLLFSYLSFVNSKKEKSVVIKESPKNSNTTANTTQEAIPQEEISANTNNNTSTTEEVKEEDSESQPTPTPPATLAKSQIIDYIDKNINSLAPASPHAGVWNVNRYWFTSNNDVYVEYASDGELKQMLVSVDTGNENTTYTRKAAFKAGESSWILIEGEDTQFGKTRELYEKAGDKWVKKN